jgi:hypothetical protein
MLYDKKMYSLKDKLLEKDKGEVVETPKKIKKEKKYENKVGKKKK